MSKEDIEHTKKHTGLKPIRGICQDPQCYNFSTDSETYCINCLRYIYDDIGSEDTLMGVFYKLMEMGEERDNPWDEKLDYTMWLDYEEESLAWKDYWFRCTNTLLMRKHYD